jgi:hypothetical protein
MPWSFRSVLSSLICFRVFNRLSQPVTALCGVLLLTCGMETLAAAQAAHFSGVQSTVGSTGQYEPGGVAVDSSGNVYIVDETYGNVYKETLTATGRYVQSTVASGLNQPSALAVDRTGNVYVSNYRNMTTYGIWSVFIEKPSGGSYTQSTVVSDMPGIGGIAVDGSGNVYITAQGGYVVDQSGNSHWQLPCLLIEAPASGGYIQSTLVSSLNYPQGIAVDTTGNLYYADSAIFKGSLSPGGYVQSTLLPIQGAYGVAVDSSGNLYLAIPSSPTSSRVLKETLSGGTYAGSPIGVDLNFSDAVAVDGNGVAYISDAFNSRVLKETPSGGNFGTVNVGSPSTKMSWIFTFDTAGTIGTPVVLTQGSTGLDFADSGTGSCTTNGTTFEYNVGDTCTVDVVFTPTTTGTRSGSVELLDNSGMVISTGSAQGVGQSNGVTLDFTITSPGTGTPSVSASAGGQAVYPFVISPTGSTGMPGTVSLSVTGLPAGASAVFSPSKVSAGTGPTNVILLVNLPTQSAMQPLSRSFRVSALPVALTLIVLPFVGSWRKAARHMNRMAWTVVLGLFGMTMIAGLAGCGGGSGSSSNSSVQQTYSLTITATSGTLSHSTAATLIVK